MNRCKYISGSSVRRIFRFLLSGAMICLFWQTSFGQPGSNRGELWQENITGRLTGQYPERLHSKTDFYDYARVRDEAFSEYLKEAWHDYSILPGTPEEPRITGIREPVFKSSALDITPPTKLPFSGVIGSNDTDLHQINRVPGIRKPESELFSSLTGTFLFYGQQINLHYDKLIKLSVANSVSEDSVSGFWESFSRSNSYQLVDQLMDYRDQLGLGDWGYFQLVRTASNHIFPENRWKSDQLTWALMIRSGFDVRLAYNQSSTTVLFSSDNTIYSRQSVMIGKKRFYSDREMKSQLLITYPNAFPDAESLIDLRFPKSLNFSGKLNVRRFSVLWNNKNQQLALRYNPNVIRFYADYPKCDPSVYFGAPVAAIFKEDVLSQLYPLFSKINKIEATALLQQFVQHEFYYCSAENKEGSGSGRFAEEVIASKSGDDRAKAVLFSWLIRTLLKLPVVGLQFPGYYSAAVCFNEPFEGDSYFWRQRNYVVTDPTFVNGPIGVMVPELRDLTAQLIDLPGAGLPADKRQNIWKLANKMGANRGGAGQDLIFDRQERAFITGYFGDKRSSHPFVACFSEENSLQWIRKFEGGGKATAFAITRLSDDEIYIAGSFSGRITMDNKTVESTKNVYELFFAQLNQYGELVWIRKVAADSTVTDKMLPFLVSFDRTGDHLSIHWLNEDQRNVKTGFGGVRERGLYFTGSGVFTGLSGTAPKQDNTGEMTKIGNFLTRMNCHPKVTGIMTVLRWLQKPGNEVTGSQIQAYMVSWNPSFATDHPLLFMTLGRISLLKNENGIVTIKTVDYKSVIFNSLRVEDGARFKISVYGNNDLSAEIISGIKNIVNPVLLSLNSLLIDFSSGNFILDYDHDHTLKTLRQ